MWCAAIVRNFQNGAVIFESTYISDLLSVDRPDGIVPILRETTRRPAQRRGHPDVAPESAELETARRCCFDETRARRTRGGEGNGGAVRRKVRLDVLSGIVGDVHFLS